MGERATTPYCNWEGHTVDQVLTNWRNGQKLYDAYVHGDLPASVLWHYREYTRPLKPELLEKIRTEGYDRECPVIVAVSKNGKAWVAEGNHRLVVARELGIEKLPVRFVFYVN